MSWIKHHSPTWVSRLEEALPLLEHHAGIWVGQCIEETWVGLLPGHGSWWADFPIILVIGGIQYEICWQKFADLAITQGQINVRNAWANGQRVPMRKNHLPALNQALGKRILAIELGESEMDFGGPPIRIINSVNFVLEGGYLGIFNAGDENAVSGEGILPNKKELAHSPNLESLIEFAF